MTKQEKVYEERLKSRIDELSRYGAGGAFGKPEQDGAGAKIRAAV